MWYFSFVIWWFVVHLQVFPSPTTGALNLRNDYEEVDQQEMKGDVKNYSVSAYNPQTGSSVSSYFQSSSSNLTLLVNVCRFVNILFSNKPFVLSLQDDDLYYLKDI